MEHLYLEQAVATTPDAMIALDEHFRLTDLNPAGVLALGQSSQELIGSRCMSVLRCRNLNHMELCGTSSCPLVRVLHQKQPLPHEELIIGNNCEVSVSVTPITLHGEQQAVFTARDMSALKVVNRVRANFVSMVSHELRTPLNSVHGFVDLLLHGHMGTLTDEQHMYLGYAQEAVQQLVSMVEDILLLTRSDLGQFEIRRQEVDTIQLVKQVMTSLQPQATQTSVILLEDIPSSLPSLFIDPQRMKQVLTNLVTNAIKFTPFGGIVTIRMQPYNEEFALISVADTGFGIPEEDRHHVYERFYQSNHRQQSKMGGYGLGLSIAKLIVEQHGGTISFESVVNQGTTFMFTVPLKID